MFRRPNLPPRRRRAGLMPTVMLLAAAALALPAAARAQASGGTSLTIHLPEIVALYFRERAGEPDPRAWPRGVDESPDAGRTPEVASPQPARATTVGAPTGPPATPRLRVLSSNPRLRPFVQRDLGAAGARITLTAYAL